MIKLELNDKSVGVHRAGLDAAIRQIGRELDRLGTQGLVSALTHLQDIFEAARELEAAAQRPAVEDAAPLPKPPMSNGEAQQAAH